MDGKHLDSESTEQGMGAMGFQDCAEGRVDLTMVVGVNKKDGVERGSHA